jgi:hypothetical protein
MQDRQSTLETSMQIVTRIFYVGVLAAGLIVGVAAAQSPGSESPSAHTDRLITEAMAVTLIEAHGYHHVSGLRQGPALVWRGTAERYGTVASVSIDRNGNFSDRD